MCDIQGRLFLHSKKAFRYVDPFKLDIQPNEVQHYTLGVMSSCLLLEGWAKSEAGVKIRREFLLANAPELDDDLHFVEEMLERIGRKKWDQYPELSKNCWVNRTSQRHQ